MAITLRNTKGSALTHTELDNNFREFYYSASYNDFELQLFKSTSLEDEFKLPINVGKGPALSIQVKSGSALTGSEATVTGSSNFTFDFGSNILNLTGSGNITGNLTVGGVVTAERFHSEVVSSSIIFESGSTKFGDSADDTHVFTGSMFVIGTVDVSTGITGSDLKIDDWNSISGSLSGHNTRITTLESSGIISSSTQIAGLGAGIISASSQIADLGANIPSSSSQIVTFLDNQDLNLSSVTSSNAIFTNIVVNGTGSFALIESITGSAKIIGDAFIQLNENTPSQRYAGIQVVDSGSSFATASFFFDGLVNNWMYEYTDAGSDYALALFGPEFPTKGSPVSLTPNTVPIATGSHHLVDSNITDDGSTVTINSASFAIPGFPNVSASLATAVASSGIQNIVEDTTPQLGGNLDLNSNNISGSGTIDISGNISGSLLNINGMGTSRFTSHLQAHCLGIGTSPTGNGGEIKATSGSFSGPISGSNLNINGDITGSNLLINGTVDATGDITAFYSSDERLKDNITPLSDAVNKINQIGGYEFDWNSNSSHSGHDVGVIAQEIEKVLPEVVVDRDNGYKAVRYDKIVALLINAIKEQQLQIDELKSKL